MSTRLPDLLLQRGLRRTRTAYTGAAPHDAHLAWPRLIAKARPSSVLVGHPRDRLGSVNITRLKARRGFVEPCLSPSAQPHCDMERKYGALSHALHLAGPATTWTPNLGAHQFKFAPATRREPTARSHLLKDLSNRRNRRALQLEDLRLLYVTSARPETPSEELPRSGRSQRARRSQRQAAAISPRQRARWSRRDKHGSVGSRT